MGGIIFIIMGIMGILGGAPIIGIIFIGVGLYFVIPAMKYKKKLKNLDITNDELKKAQKRRDELFNKTLPKNDFKEEEKNEKLEYENWVKNVKANTSYKGKDFFNIDNLGLLWYENNNYYLYLVNTSKKMYEMCSEYKDGLIISNKIDIKENTQYETIHHNNKLKGALVGAAIAGTAGAVVGQNVENTTETKEQDRKYYFIIDDKKFEIEMGDFQIIRQFDKENGNTIKG